jgi:transposase
LRAAGRDRAVQITRATAAKQLIRDQLGLVAPALLAAHCEPLDSATWLASLEVMVERGGLAAVAGMGYEQFAALVRDRLGGWGGQRLGPTAARVFAAVPSAGAVTRMLRAAVRRISGALEDLKHARGRRERLEAQMTGLLDELGTDHARICQTPGLTAPGLGRGRRPGSFVMVAPAMTKECDGCANHDNHPARRR